MRKTFYFALAVVCFVGSVPLSALEPPESSLDRILISEIQAGAAGDATKEFVELYNPTNQAVSLTNWKIEYLSASTKTATRTNLAGHIEPRGFYLVATQNYLAGLADAILGSQTRINGSGGHLRIIEPTNAGELEHDRVGWGDAINPEQVAAEAPKDGESLKRVVSEDGEFIDTDKNLDDFIVSDHPEPQSTPAVLPPPEPNPDPTEYLPIEISELFIDPVSPQTDAQDEFVELFNPNAGPIDLAGYKIQTGSSLQYSYVITDHIIEPQSYAVFYARDTDLLLPNSAGRAQVLDPAGAVAAEMVSYEAAPAGESWAIFSDAFAWTNVVTPGEENQSRLEGGTGNEDSGDTAETANYLPILITELLPDPDNPQTDANDEFVELYNPNREAVNLKGYTLLTGSTLRTKHVIGDLIVPPGAYIALFANNTNIGLGNTGGAVQLLSPNGSVLSGTVTYGEAEPGQSWALVDGKWQWTAEPTPAAGNVYSAAPAKKKKAAAKKSSKKTNSKKSSGDILGNLSQPAAIAPAPPNWRLIASIGTLAAGYMIYELRHDIRNQMQRLRSWLPSKTGKP